MITRLEPIPQLLGLWTNVDSSQVPLGGMLYAKNLAQLVIGRLRRIPGVVAASTPVVDAQLQIPLAFWAKGLGASGAGQLIAIFVGSATVSVVNVSTGLTMAGPALAAAAFGKPWTATFYNNKWMFAGGDNTSIYQLDDATTYSAVVGAPAPPGGNLICAFLNRLYVSDIAGSEGITQYSDVLTTDFQAVSLVNTKELPGKVTALLINSPSTDTLGIQTQLVIAKDHAIWIYDETRKDLISSVVGIPSQNVAANTDAGLVFYGRKGTKPSVFWMPIGSVGEPVNVGGPLKELLNGTSVISNDQVAHGVYHDKFFKLFYSTGGANTNTNEVWLDTELLAADRSVVWYGPHARGAFDCSVVADDVLNLFVRGTSGAAKRFQERTSADANFTDSSGNTLIAELDLPLNVEPLGEEKAFVILELQAAKEANLSGNQVLAEPFSEGTSQGSFNVSLYNGETSPNGIARVQVPLHAAGKTAMTARNARIKLVHSLNQRFDILGIGVQYMHYEGTSRVRNKD